MKSQLSWVLVLAALSAGCASRPVSEAEALASSIERQPTKELVCGVGDVRYCAVQPEGGKRCACVDHHTLFSPR